MSFSVKHNETFTYSNLQDIQKDNSKLGTLLNFYLCNFLVTNFKQKVEILAFVYEML